MQVVDQMFEVFGTAIVRVNKIGGDVARSRRGVVRRKNARVVL